MSVVLVNGDGNPAVHASQDADLLGGIGGQETGILDINDKFAATIADANTVEISSGVCITKEGRRIQIDVGDVEEIVVPTGSQGTTKYYIIGFHLYTDGSGNQLAETFIDEVASPSATITEKMFKDGETEVYVSLYRITRNGLNLEGLTLILPEIGSLAGGGIIGNTDISGIADGTVTGAIAQINTDLSVRYNSQTDRLEVLLNGTWVPTLKAWAQQVNVWKDGVFGTEVDNGVYASVNGYTPNAFAISGSNLVSQIPSAQNACSSLVVKEEIDFSSYDMITIVTSTHGTLTIDVSQYSGTGYLGIAFQRNSVGYTDFVACVATTKTNFSSNAISGLSASTQQSSSIGSATITEITIA